MSIERVAEITTAAERLFGERGYHATTVRQVARALDLQGGSLYSHIESKEALLAAIVDRAADEFESAIVPIVEMDAPSDQRLRRAVAAHIGVICSNLAAAKVYFQDWRHLTGPMKENVKDRRDRYEEHWRAIIRDGARSGTFHRNDVEMAARHCLGACNWVYQWYDPVGPLEPSEVAAQVSTLLLDGLYREPSA